MPRIHLKNLQKIVREELQRHFLVEQEQRKVALDHADAASKALDAIEKYKEVASSKANAELQDSLERVEQILNRIVASPLNYADVVPDEPTEDGSVSAAQVPLTSNPPDQPKRKVIKPTVVGKPASTELDPEKL